MHLHRQVLICLALSLALCGCVFLGPVVSHGQFSVAASPGSSRRSVQTVFADVGAFARKRGFLREPSRNFDLSSPVADKPNTFQRHSYYLNLDSSNKYPHAGITLQIVHWHGSRRVGIELFGTYGGRYQKVTDQFVSDFDQEFSGRYGVGSISKTSASLP